MRKTKMIATIGPATDTEPMLSRLVQGGVDVFRLNMSHGKDEWVRRVVPAIRKCSVAAGRTTAVLMDLQGPSIRTGDVDAPLVLKEGEAFEFTLGGAAAEIPLSTAANYPGLAEDLSAGDVMLVDNGEIHLRVVSTSPERIRCEVLTDGEMGSRRHINLPGVYVRLPGLTEKDRANVALAKEVGVDFVALSFAREADHIEELRSLFKGESHVPQIVAKIEDQEAVRNLDEIIVAADAVMVARGDLGIEVNIEELPVIQRRIVRKCIKLGRRVIVATHMLESMVENPSPTRAEVTDVANAAYEEADAVMLSGETSVGSYPLRSVDVLRRIVERNEGPGAGFAEGALLKTAKQKTVRAAVTLADSLPGSKIVVFTKRGVLANFVSNLRPADAPVFAFTADANVVRGLSLSRSVTALEMPLEGEPEELVGAAFDRLKGLGLVATGDSVVVLSDVLGGEYVQDSIILRRVGE